MDPELKKLVDADSTFKRPDNASQYIRTYAKDVAQITGTKVSAPVASAKTKNELREDIALATDGSAYKAVRAIHAEPAREILSIDSLDTEVPPYQAELSERGPREETPLIVPILPDEGEVSESQKVLEISRVPESKDDRDAILARLKARFAPEVVDTYLSKHPTNIVEKEVPAPVLLTTSPLDTLIEPVPVVAAVPPVIVPEISQGLSTPFVVDEEALSTQSNVSQSLPSIFKDAGTVKEREPVPFSRSRELEYRANRAEAPSPLQTYSGDFSKKIDSDKASTFAVLAAESDAKRGFPVTAPKKSPFATIIFGVLFLIAGTLGIFGAFVFLRDSSFVPVELSVPSHIFTDTKIEITGTSALEQREQFIQIKNGPLVDGKFVLAYTKNTTGMGIENGAVLARSLLLGAPDILLRNIGTSTVGVLTTEKESSPFFILAVTSYERTFAGMLSWERTLLSDLALLYPEGALPYTFSDAVELNRDVRIIRDMEGKTLFVYGYLNKEILLLVRDEAAFSALLKQIQSTNAR